MTLTHYCGFIQCFCWGLLIRLLLLGLIIFAMRPPISNFRSQSLFFSFIIVFPLRSLTPHVIPIHDSRFPLFVTGCGNVRLNTGAWLIVWILEVWECLHQSFSHIGLIIELYYRFLLFKRCIIQIESLQLRRFTLELSWVNLIIIDFVLVLKVGFLGFEALRDMIIFSVCLYGLLINENRPFK